MEALINAVADHANPDLNDAFQDDPIYQSLNLTQKVELFERGTCPGHVGRIQIAQVADGNMAI